jgi:hypothetical protein
MRSTFTWNGDQADPLNIFGPVIGTAAFSNMDSVLKGLRPAGLPDRGAASEASRVFAFASRNS